MGQQVITNWNNYPKVSCTFRDFTLEEELSSILADNTQLISRGNGRCYGDASLGQSIISTLHFNRILSFNEATGVITCQSGILLSNILEVITPRGWFLPVTPGTRFITLGGAVASDIHGKNHHKEGAFSQHIINMRVLTPVGEIISCSATERSEFFWFTCGGMGLTGVVLDVTLQLKKIETGYIRELKIKARNLHEVLDFFDYYIEYTYSVAWIDCLKTGTNFGRSILMLGEHANQDELKVKQFFPHNPKTIAVPLYLPSFALNNLSVRAFNMLYYGVYTKREIHSLTTYQSFFYPLDLLLHWNRIYGKRGFVQYQFVIPKEQGKKGVADILQRINKKGWASFLAVLKLFGKDEGPISFQMEGYTLALDFAMHKDLFPFLDELDKVVMSYGGRIYMSKDARMKPEIFHATYPKAAEFKNFVNSIDPHKKIVSSLAQRLHIK